MEKNAIVAKGGVALVLLSLSAVIGCGQPTSTRQTTTLAPSTGTAVSKATGTASATATSVTATSTVTDVAKPGAAEPGAVGTVAPPLKGKTWLTADGKAPEFKNKAYLVEFWSVT
jgi:hypothetical protein